MKTFAEFLPTLTAREREIVEAFHTAREREIVEAFHLATEYWHEEDNPKTDWSIAQMRTTPPAKEPVSVETLIQSTFFANGEVMHAVVPHGTVVVGDRVRITKMEAGQ